MSKQQHWRHQPKRRRKRHRKRPVLAKSTPGTCLSSIMWQSIPGRRNQPLRSSASSGRRCQRKASVRLSTWLQQKMLPVLPRTSVCTLALQLHYGVCGNYWGNASLEVVHQPSCTTVCQICWSSVSGAAIACWQCRKGCARRCCRWLARHGQLCIRGIGKQIALFRSGLQDWYATLHDTTMVT